MQEGRRDASNRNAGPDLLSSLSKLEELAGAGPGTGDARWLLREAAIKLRRQNVPDFRTLDTDLTSDRSHERLRIAILTPGGFGIVRGGGGIGTAYFHAAAFLAREGHDVTLAALTRTAARHDVQAFCRRLGINVVAVDPGLSEAAEAHELPLGRSHAAYEWLKRQAPFDLVHVSEWRGIGFVPLAAKRLGLAFIDTHFVVKASSPTLWNAEGNKQPLLHESDLDYAYMERRSIELADTVISGSRHLLAWMWKRGYDMPARSFVWPNIFLPALNEDVAAESAPTRSIRTDPSTGASGKTRPVSEVVFFGRLEPRKGVILFVDALNALAESGVKLPPVTFLGSPAPRFDAEGLIAQHQRQWRTTITVKSGLSPAEAVDYLSKPGRLAVMPSLLENSSIAIYECLYNGIPFLGSTAGGTPELVAEADRDAVLFEPDHAALAAALRHALASGAVVARPRWALDRSSEVWSQWHRTRGSLLRTAAAANRARKDRALAAAPRVSVHLSANGPTRPAIASIEQQTYPHIEILNKSAVERAVPGGHLLYFDARNTMKPGMVEMLVRAMEYAELDVLTCNAVAPAHAGAVSDAPLRTLGPVTLWGFFKHSAACSTLMIRRAAWQAMLEGDDRLSPGSEPVEFIAQAIFGRYALAHLPEELYVEAQRGAGAALAPAAEFQSYRAAELYLQHAPEEIRGTMLYLLGQAMHRRAKFRGHRVRAARRWIRAVVRYLRPSGAR
jgi:glycosyltransferase involved in cell wall biosynthesis